MLTKKEVAAICRVSTRTIDRLRSRGDFPAGVKVGQQVRWRPESIQHLASKDTHKAS